MSKLIAISDTAYTALTTVKAQAKQETGKQVTYAQLIDCLIELCKK